MALTRLNFFTRMWILIFVLISFNCVDSLTFSCPSNCRCSDNYSSESADDTKRTLECRVDSQDGLISFPELHPEVEVFTLTAGSYLKQTHEETFRGSQQLEQISLNNSQLEDVGKETFSGLWKLSRLDLSGNKLMFLSLKAFWKLESFLVTLNLRNNPWHCDCELRREMERIHEAIFFDINTINCSTPVEFQGMNLFDIGESDVCPRLGKAKIGNVIFLLVILVLAIVLTIACIIYYYGCIMRQYRHEKLFKPPQSVIKYYPKVKQQPSDEVNNEEHYDQYDSLPNSPRVSLGENSGQSKGRLSSPTSGSFTIARPRPEHQLSPNSSSISNQPASILGRRSSRASSRGSIRFDLSPQPNQSQRQPSTPLSPNSSWSSSQPEPVYRKSPSRTSSSIRDDLRRQPNQFQRRPSVPISQDRSHRRQPNLRDSSSRYEEDKFGYLRPPRVANPGTRDKLGQQTFA